MSADRERCKDAWKDSINALVDVPGILSGMSSHKKGGSKLHQSTSCDGSITLREKQTARIQTKIPLL
jgi:hypothetical protein